MKRIWWLRLKTAHVLLGVLIPMPYVDYGAASTGDITIQYLESLEPELAHSRRETNAGYLRQISSLRL
jgi:hypothetical protein